VSPAEYWQRKCDGKCCVEMVERIARRGRALLGSTGKRKFDCVMEMEVRVGRGIFGG
jgi:hypothetical protein